MLITVDVLKGNLAVQDRDYLVSNRVRTLKDGTREKTEIINSVPANLPYDPRPFPHGLWNITAVEWQKDKGFNYNEYGAVKIRTDAYHMVNVWELDDDGDYLRETEKKVKDIGYLLHWSVHRTTLGCIKIEHVKDAIEIAEMIEQAMKSGESVQIDVR